MKVSIVPSVSLYSGILNNPRISTVIPGSISEFVNGTLSTLEILRQPELERPLLDDLFFFGTSKVSCFIFLNSSGESSDVSESDSALSGWSGSSASECSSNNFTLSDGISTKLYYSTASKIVPFWSSTSQAPFSTSHRLTIHN